MALPRGLIYLCLATAAASSRHNKKNSHTHIAPHKYGDDAVGAYAKTWAAPNTNRSVAHFFEQFGAIDVGCTYDVERSGAHEHTPKLVFKFADGSTVTSEPGAYADDRFRARPAVCEYARGPTADAAMLFMASSAEYLFRLWPLFLNKILYATEAELRPFVWIGELPDTLTRVTSPGCFLSLPNQARFAQKVLVMHNNRRLADSFTTDHYDLKDVTHVSNHHVKMPATLAVLAHPHIRGLYYVDLDSVAQLPFNLTRVRSTHAGYADVVFKWTKKLGPATLRWKVMGSRYTRATRPSGASSSRAGWTTAARSRTSTQCGTLF